MRCKVCGKPMKRVPATNIYICTCPIGYKRNKVIRCDCFVVAK